MHDVLPRNSLWFAALVLNEPATLPFHNQPDNCKSNIRSSFSAARERIGPDTILMLDANNAWPDLPTALRCARMYEQYDPYFLEEPSAAVKRRGYDRLYDEHVLQADEGVGFDFC